MNTEQTIVSEFWGSDQMVARRGKLINWTEHPQVLAYMCELMSGDPTVHWDLHFWTNYLLPQSRPLNVLSLGCGLGELEISLMKRGSIGSMTACDISQGALNRAREAASQAGVEINFVCADLNRLSLPCTTYDVVIGSSSLHHVVNLEPLMYQVRQSLRANGLFVINEYVGPNRFQFPPLQVSIINGLFDILPEKYRWRISDPSVLKDSIDYPTVDFLLKHDPSEAVRSADIISCLINTFQVYERRPFGGSVLHFLLYDIAGNFSPSDTGDSTVMKLLINTEKVLIESGVLASDFIYMVLGR